MSHVTRERPFLQSVVALVAALVLGAGGLLLGFALTFLVAGLLIVGIGLELSPALSIVLSLVFVQGIGCAGVALSYLKVRPHLAGPIRDLLQLSETVPRFDISAAVPSMRDAATIVAGYLVAIGGALLGSAAITVVQRVTGTELETGTNQAAQIGMENPEVLLLLIPASILVIGPGEEMLFRGVVQGRIREVFSPVPGVLIPSVIFAGLHWFALSGGSPQGNLVTLGVLVVPALVFGVAYEYTDNIVVPALIHGLYNATLFTMLFVVVKYGDQLPQQALLA
ncbi:CPBP family intramembrane glutamic endopeptidase [Haloarcula pellucida]|uniref:CPBP family intramembrane metalloprotease n=1 Tax=Haloarcula pellucida TaxID=1427151 RepID=A0A830GIY2_9EURY|nr:CPBP family intramembrane glutamic endopeptidase [Halomicroarcula pellucida]MBX0347212.1 CPBP family intramembrane metalloprotease [Halomicroarcula pellucida]GGN87546.1 CPBP family intramembrane metalloprotease [Halomicroarcula pellucida]